MYVKSLFLAVAALLVSADVAAADESTRTEIRVEKMHCAGCAKKIAARLYAVRGVKEVRYDLETKVLFVQPTKNGTPSPRAMWDAVEKAKDRPIKLAGPGGTFTTKPKH